MRHQYGCKPDKEDARDLIFTRQMPIRAVRAVPMVDLRSKMPPIYDQGQLGSCTANAVAGLIQYERMKLHFNPNFLPSRLFIYYNERIIEGTVGWDSGATIRDSIKAVAQYGECSETMWGYNISQFTTRPTTQCYTEALKYRAVQYQRIQNNSLATIKSALVSGNPITFGFYVYESFDSNTVARTGVVPMPARRESILGGHACVIVGYNDATARFIVRNSWGTSWGMQGYFTIPYIYLTNTQIAFDFWVITATLA